MTDSSTEGGERKPESANYPSPPALWEKTAFLMCSLRPLW